MLSILYNIIILKAFTVFYCDCVTITITLDFNPKKSKK